MGRSYTVERSATLAASPAAIYAQLIDFREWPGWSPWDELDPDMTKTYSGADSGVGARYAWSGNRKVGQGNMEITGAEEASEVTIALEFLKPFKARNTTVFTSTPRSEGTHVSWPMTGKTTLMTRIMGIFKSMDAMVGPDLEKGLEKLGTVTGT
jgi:hypothetical protein